MERTLGTFIASVMGLITVETVESLAETDWVQAGWVVGATTLYTFLKCILVNVSPGSSGPGLGNVEILNPKEPRT